MNASSQTNLPTPHTEDDLRALIMDVLNRAGPMESKKWVCDELVNVLAGSRTSTVG